jgi:hypothetical protein
VTQRLSLLLVLLAGCGARSVAGSADEAACLPGTQTTCACPQGQYGVQVCASDGRKLLECQCGVGSGGTSSSGGSGAESGRSGGAGTGGAGGATAGAGGGGSIAPGTLLVVDAEYSRALDRVVILTEPPAELHVYDPVSELAVVVSLPIAGSSVSVSPDGLRAAVGHDGWVTLVDLVEGVVVASHPASCDALDIVLAGNDFAYVFPVRDQWTSIRCIDLETGVEETSTGQSIYAGTLGKLSPRGDAIYGANNGLSPSDIEKYDIRDGVAAFLYDSPYHGDYYMCGALWFDEPGDRIFTRCGNVFHATSDVSTDMRYAGSLGINMNGDWRGGIVDLTHASAAGHVLAIIGSTATAYGGVSGGTEIAVYEQEFLNLVRTLPVADLGPGISECRFIFLDGAGTTAWALCGQAEGRKRIVRVPF